MVDSFFIGLGKVVFTPFAWLLRLVGTVTQPISGLLDSGLVKAVLLIIVVFVLHRLTFDRDGTRHMIDMNMELKMQAFPWLAANVLAMFVTASGPYAYLHFFDVLMPGVDMKATCFNFMEWGLAAKFVLVLLLIIGFLTMLFYFGLGARHGFRFLCGVILAALVGSVYVELHLGMLIVADELGIGGLLAALINLLDSVLTVLEGFVSTLCCVAFGVWFKPMAALRERAQRMKEREARERMSEKEPEFTGASGLTDSETIHTVLDLPDVIIGPYEETYRKVSMSTDFAVYSGDQGGGPTTIHVSDIILGGSSAKTSDGYFHW